VSKEIDECIEIIKGYKKMLNSSEKLNKLNSNITSSTSKDIKKLLEEVENRLKNLVREERLKKLLNK